MTRPLEEHQEESLARRFVGLCSEGEPPDVFSFLDSAQPASARETADVLMLDQEQRIKRGCLLPAEDYLARCPLLAESDILSLELIANEFFLRKDQGEDISTDSFLERFPRLKSLLSGLLTSSEAESSGNVTTIEVGLPSLLRAEMEDTLSDAAESPQSGTETESMVLPPDFLRTSDPTKSATETVEQTPSTLEWDPALHGMPRPGTSEDTARENADQTLPIAPEALGEMMQDFARRESRRKGAGQAIESHAVLRSSTPDTLFDEGAAYDKSRPLGEFGDYILLEEIARGGMGVVFKARQKKLKRIVALKMILAGQLAGEEEVRRFYAEAESAAALDHPNIVPVYEVGQYRGQHFFSMGYVEGDTLADKVAERPLAPRAAAQMMKTISEAVEYAHQQGVIHRDLKPANVLLDAHELPRIMDFGLAKKTEGGAELTTTGQIMGTPTYMSPEQATGKSSDVGPRSDVYSLGAMLYCLLTGRPPFQAPTVLELLQQVKSQEPVSPKRLTPNLPVDLETVCLKCLDKDPERRYESAQELADDLGRFLEGRPVVARPIGQAERFLRWCKRYPLIAGLMAAVIISLSLGAGFSTYYAIAAGRRAKEAIDQYERAERNFQRAEDNFARAERNFQKAQAAVNQFFVQVSENTLLNQPGMQPLQRELLSQALEYYKDFLKERGDDPDLKDELAITQFRVGLITEAVESPAAAIAPLQTARQLQTALMNENPHDLDRKKALGNTLTALGKVIYRARTLQEAEEIYQEALKIRQDVFSQAGDDPETHRELANAYMNLGLIERKRGQAELDPAQQQVVFEEALSLYGNAQKIRRELLMQSDLPTETLHKVDRDLGQGAYNLGNIYLQMNQPEQAFANYREATVQFDKALAIDPENQKNTLELAICYRLMALGSDNPNQSWDYITKANERLEPLVRANPKIDDYRKELIQLKIAMTETALNLKHFPAAKEALQEAREHIEVLLAAETSDSRLLLNALVIYRMIAELSEASESLATELPPLEKIRSLTGKLENLLAEDSALERMRADLAIELLQLGFNFSRLGLSKPAWEFSLQGSRVIDELVAASPSNLDYHFNQHFARVQLAQLLVKAGQLDEARKTYGDLLAALSQLDQQLSPMPDLAFERGKIQFERAKTQIALAGIFLKQNEPAQALKELNEAAGGLRSLILQFPNAAEEFQKELEQTLKMKQGLSPRPADAEKPTSDTSASSMRELGP